MKRLQVIRSVITKDIIKEIKYHTVSSFQKFSLIFVSILTAGFAIYDFTTQKYTLAIIFLALTIICIVELVLLYRNIYKDAMKMFGDDREEVTFTMSFGSDSVTIHNCYDNTNTKLPYEHMKEISETKNVYVIIGKYGEVMMISKVSLKNDFHEISDFLKTKHTKIKKWPC